MFSSEVLEVIAIATLFGGAFLVLFFAARMRRRAPRIALAVVAFIALVIQGGCVALVKEINDSTSGSGNSTLMGWMVVACVAGAIYSVVLIFTRGKTQQSPPHP